MNEPARTTTGASTGAILAFQYSVSAVVGSTSDCMDRLGWSCLWKVYSCVTGKDTNGCSALAALRFA